MRIVSLLPAGTEIVAALGAADQLVAISHECDFPPGVLHLPRITTTPIPAHLSGRAIDHEVRRLKATGEPVIAVDGEIIRRLSPDLVITQNLCEVCAVADGAVHRLAALLEPAPRVLALEARDLAGIRADIMAVGQALGRGERAVELVEAWEGRLHEIADAGTCLQERPGVVCIEWLEPLFLAGHWVPEMVELAGGHDVGAVPGSHSVEAGWSRVRQLEPDLAIVMLCGFSLERAVQELALLEDGHPLANLPCPVLVLDGNAFTSRAGPRVVEGAALIQAALKGEERPGLITWKRRAEAAPASS